MERTVYLNGEFLGEEKAKVSIFDRGFLFADGVYEVTAVLDGKLVDFDGHITRLKRSMTELGMPYNFDPSDLLDIHRELVNRNNVDEGAVYIQVTRGTADRDFLYSNSIEQTIVLFTQKKSLTEEKSGVKVISMDDLRWGRRDIKTVQLLAPSLAKTYACSQGKDDAWLVEDGYVTEGTANNAFIVTENEEIITRNLSNSILHGITRAAVLKLADEKGFSIVERPFSIEEAQEAVEAFITSATTFVCPVVEIDGVALSDGETGPIVKRLSRLYVDECRKKAI